MDNVYDLDIALDIVAEMFADKSKEFLDCQDEKEKQKLKRELDMIREERNTLYFTRTPMFDSVMDKAFRLYAPIIRHKREMA
jgi:hypothetical protein